jgi:predicted DNA-binding transcriptional regulator AlpA
MHQYVPRPQDDLPILLDLEATKKALDIGTTTIYKWCSEGLLTPIKFGKRCTRFRLSEIHALIDKHAAPAGKVVSHE